MTSLYKASTSVNGDEKCEYAKGSPNFEDSKESSYEKFSQGKHARNVDRERRARKNNHKDKPPRKKFKCEGPLSLVMPPEARELIEKWASTAEMETTVADNMGEFCVKTGAYAASLATCETTAQFLTASLQYLASFASKEIVEYFSQRRPVSCEGPSDALDKVLAFVRSARGSYAELVDTPLYRFLIDIIGIAAACGCAKEMSVGECKVISAEWLRVCSDAVIRDFPSVVMRSVEFTLEVATTVARGGTLGTFVSGRGVLTTVARLLAREQDVKSRMLERKHNVGIDQHLCECNSVRVRLQELISHSHGVLFTLASTQLAKLDQHISTVNEVVKVSGFRARPYTVLLAGPSGVGKSTHLHELITKVGQVNGFPTKPENIAEISETDRYDSTITGTSFVYQLDDMCQSKDLTQLSEKPHERMIRYNNTAPAMAIKADVGEKGCIPIQPKFIAITSNVAHLQAGAYMNSPQALLHNRINKAVWMTVKKSCAREDGTLDPEKVNPNETSHVVREITYSINDGKVTPSYGPEMDIKDWTVLMLRDAKAHREHQESLRLAFEQKSSYTICKTCCHDKSACECKVVFANEGLVQLVRKAIMPHRHYAERGRAWMRALHAVERFSWRDWLFPLEEVLSRMLTMFFWQVMVTFYFPIALIGFSLFFLVFGMFYLHVLFGCVALASVLYFAHLVCFQSRGLLAKAIVDEMTNISTDFGTSYGSAALGVLLDNVVVAIIFVPILGTLRMMLRAVTFANEGAISNPDMCTIRARRKEQNEWLTAPKIIPVTGSEAARTSTFDNAVKVITKRTCLIEAPISEDSVGKIHGVNVCANWILMPKHGYEKFDKKKEWTFTFDEQTFGPNRISLVDETSARRVGLDHVAVRVEKLNRNGDIRKYFPTGEFTSGQMTTGVVCRKFADIVEQDVMGTFCKNILTEEADGMIGFKGKIEHLTADGDCGSPWIRRASPHVILGLHNGRDKKTVICETIYASDLDFMSKVRYTNEGGQTVVTVATPPVVTVKTEYYGEEILTGQELRPGSCMNYCELNPLHGVPLVEAYGSCDNLRYSNSRSTVVRSPLSQALAKCGNPCIWGSPPLHVKRNHEEVFRIASHPLNTIDGRVMYWAVADYCKDVIRTMTNIQYLTAPLTPDEVFNGRKNENINPMNMKTSPGLGLHGKKIDHCNVTVTKEGNKYSPKEYVATEIDRIRSLLRNGIRACPVSKTALKDEPMKLTKDVARIFYVMPMAFIACCREVLCPILAFMMECPIVCESWFGIKVTTDEWGQCFDHLNQFGNNVAMNGDYSRYDLHFSSQLITAVGNVFATLGHHLGYSPSDVVMVSSIFGDLSNPIYVFGGTLISFLGLMPSGNPATVAINGVGNSLLHRSFFAARWLEMYGCLPEVGAFRKFCAMGFVGDDSIGGVSDSIPWYNMQTYQKWLAQLGMPYTAADKRAKIPKYVPLKSASLCKRTFVDRGFMVDAPIEIDSIFKSLHMMHRINEDPNLVVSLNVTQGLRELARWDRDVFEKYVGVIRSACEKEKLQVTDLYRTYDSWREEILLKYKEAPEPMGLQLEEIDRHMCVIME
jgi:hypothetical protein